MANETFTYRVVRGRHSRNEGGERKVYSPEEGSNIIELTEAAATRMGASVERLHSSSTARTSSIASKTDAVASARVPAPTDGQAAESSTTSTTNRTTSTSTSEFDFSFTDSYTVTEMSDHVASVDDVAELKALKSYEKKNKDRVGVVKAIDDRLAELK